MILLKVIKNKKMFPTNESFLPCRELNVERTPSDFAMNDLKKYITVKEFPIVRDPTNYLIVGPSFNGRS